MAQAATAAMLPGLRHLRREGRWLPGLAAAHRSVAGTVGASLVVQVSLLVSGVATARLLGVLDRGHLALLMLLASVIPIIATLGLPLGLTYWIARSPQSARPLLHRLRRAFVLQVAAMLLLHAGALWLLFDSSPAYVKVSAAISLLSSPAVGVWITGMAILQGNHQFRSLNVSRMISPPITAVLMAGYLAVGAHSLVLASITWTVLMWTTAVVTSLAAARGLSRAALPPDREVPDVREMLSFGLRALLGSVTPLEGFQLDQAIVGIFISPAALGVYVVGVAFTNLTRFVALSIGIVAYPSVARAATTSEARRAILRFTLMGLVLCGITTAVVELALPTLVPLLFGNAFRAATAVGRVLLISALLFALRRVLSECARGAGRPGVGSLAEIVSLVTLFPMVVLLHGDGARGVAVALVIAAAAGLTLMVIGLVVQGSAPRLRREEPADEDRGPALGRAEPVARPLE